MKVVVTGATDGIGRQTALELGRLGHEVVVHGRTLAKAEAACASLRRQAPDATFTPQWADFSSLAEVRRLGGELAVIDGGVDVLLHNAGVYCKTRQQSADGFELTFAVNHLAPFLLTHLVPVPKTGRVVLVSSMTHQHADIDFDDLQSEKGYDGYSAYSTSKLCNVLFAGEWAHRQGPAPSVFSLHPGVIGTKLLHAGFGMGGASLEDGARTSVYAATDPSLAGTTNRYFSDAKPAKPSAKSQDRATQNRLYEISAALVGL